MHRATVASWHHDPDLPSPGISSFATDSNYSTDSTYSIYTDPKKCQGMSRSVIVSFQYMISWGM